MIHVKIFKFNLFQTNSVLLWDDGRKCVIVDPAFYDEDEEKEFFGFIEKNGLHPECILMTHAHFDHLFGVKPCVDRFVIPVKMGAEDIRLLKLSSQMCRPFGFREPDVSYIPDAVCEGDRICVGTMEFEVLETPGHSPGGRSYLCRDEKLLLSGDSLFAGTIGRTDLQDGDYDTLIESIFTKMLVLDGDTDVIPGHGPCTSIAEERTKNPMLQPFNEVEEEDTDQNE